MKRLLVAALLAVPLLVGGALGLTPTVVDPLPFAHTSHEPALKRLGLACTDCHAFAGEGALTPPARSLCHACHVDPVTRIARGPSACATCHPVRAELLPDSHGADWASAHAGPARSPRADCDDCHERSVCVDCHAGRGALARSPHPPAFRAAHGIEARLDPASCDTCHAAARCADCHEKGGPPW